MNTGWIYVILTCTMELLWLYGFNTSTSWWHWAITISIIVVDFYFLFKACEKLPTGTVYAIFAAAGTIGAACMDALFFGASFDLAKGFFMFLLISGIVALKLADNAAEEHEAQQDIRG